MTAADHPGPKAVGVLAATGAFLRAYMAYAGRKGATGAVLVVAGAMLEGIGLAMIAPLLAVLFQSEGTGSGKLRRGADLLFAWTGVSSTTGRTILLLGLFALVMLLRAVVLLARDVRLANLRIGFVENRRTAVATALAGASWDQVARLKHARIIQVMSSDIQQIGTGANFLTQCLTAITMLAVQCVLVVYLSLPLALAAFAMLAISALALVNLMRRANRLGKYMLQTGQNLLHGTAQFLGGLKLAVSQNLQQGFLTEFCTTQAAQSRQQLDYLRQQTELRLGTTTLSSVMGAALAVVGLTVFHVPAATLVALLLVVARMAGPSTQIQQGAQILANALPAFEAVQHLCRELAPEALPPAPAQLSCDGPICFAAVSFSHDRQDADEHGAPACGVRDVTLEIAPGQLVGVKGASGSGKTTFADLLAGLYPPQSGAVTVGGERLAGAMLATWRSRISYVAQDAFLFHDTIRRNLTWAAPQADEAAIWHALELTAAEFVRDLPAGLDTIVGERGTLLSGGERQRIALTRAVLRRPQLLILDEATSGIDLAMEDAILARLRTLAGRPTVVLISHRPESLRLCDQIITFDNGRVAALDGQASTPTGTL